MTIRNTPAALCVFVCAAVSDAQLYDVVDIDPEGHNHTVRAQAINSKGQVLARASSIWAGVFDDGSVTALSRLNNSQRLYPMDINDKGIAVGVSELSAVWWDKQGVVTALPSISFDQAAYAVNNDGVIVGMAFLPGTGIVPARWDPLPQIMPTIGGVGSGEALAINNRGIAVGVSQALNRDFHATLWRDQAVIDLGTLGGDYSFAWHINDDNQVVGESNVVNGGRPRAFLWQRGVMFDLGEDTTSARAINNYGEIIIQGTTGALHYHNGVWTDLDGDASRTGWMLRGIDDINDRGEILCDAGLLRPSLTYVDRAVVLVPRFSARVIPQRAGETNTVHVIGAMNHDQVTVIYGPNTGTTNIPNSKCAGVTVDLMPPVDSVTIQTNRHGRAQIEIGIPLKLQDQTLFVQVIDSDCHVGELTTVQF